MLSFYIANITTQTVTSTRVVDTAINAMNATGASKQSLFDLLQKGGWIMYPLYFLFIVAVYVFIERLIALRSYSRTDTRFMNIIRDNIMSGNLSAAKSLAKNTNSPVAKMIDKGLIRIGKPIESIERSMENAGKLEIFEMEKNLTILSVIAGIAPMFGFLGTIVGMIELFENINSSGFELNTIAGGIYVKMVTSASGLIVGLLAYLAHHYLSTQVNKIVNKMEIAASEFIDILHEPTSK